METGIAPNKPKNKALTQDATKPKTPTSNSSIIAPRITGSAPHVTPSISAISKLMIIPLCLRYSFPSYLIVVYHIQNRIFRKNSKKVQ